jgi:gamma-glutamyl phosphate reductase
MAMDAAAMATNIVTNLKTQNPQITGAIETELIAYWTLIAQGIVDEIIAGSTTVGQVIIDTGSSAGTYPTTGTVDS